MRRFQLQRDVDVTGVSGTGVVAEGVEFTNGQVVVQWLSAWSTTVMHERGIDSVLHIHSHDGKTRVVWLDDSGN
jgi:hypothetical protein